MTVQERTAESAESLDALVRHFPTILESLRSSYGELEARAARVERELCSANRELGNRLREIDALRLHLEAVLESLPCGVIVRDAQGDVVDVNAAAQDLLGMSGEEIRRAGSTEALCGRTDGTPQELVHPDGRRLVLSSNVSPLRTVPGEDAGSVEILDDHTERVEMSERLHAADKMAALGTMAAGIAHEIRNPMNAVKGFAALLLRRSREDETANRWCELIVDAAAEADTIIENMLSFGSPQRIRMETIDGVELLERATHLALSDADSEASIRRTSRAPAFLGDGIKLRQAIRNLIANAVDVQRRAGQEPLVEVLLSLEGDQITVHVDDAGPGVPPENRQRIFDPFYTDYADGTGLGLALVSTIVRLHGGSVGVSPEPSLLGGASFFIRIPYRPSRSKPESPRSQER